MPELIVLEHSHDADEGVYRLVVGYAREQEVDVLDEDGEPVRDVVDVPKRDADGNAVLDEEDEPVMELGLGPVKTETVRLLTPVEDFVFAADDERWQGLSAQDIASGQRDLVRDVLREREAAEVEARARSGGAELPGVGEPL
jgi:hypothetical protein